MTGFPSIVFVSAFITQPSDLVTERTSSVSAVYVGIANFSDQVFFDSIDEHGGRRWLHTIRDSVSVGWFEHTDMVDGVNGSEFARETEGV